jgi:hypothetical protein
MEIEAQVAARPPAQTGAFLERGLYDASPLGLLGTTIAIYAILIGAYAVAAAFDHQPWFVSAKAGAAIDRRAWVAVCLSLIASAALGLQRFSWLADEKDAPAFARALHAGTALPLTYSKRRLRLFTALGVAIGAGAMFWFLTRTAPGRDVGAGVAIWSEGMAGLLGAMFLRGLEMTRAGSRHTREVLRKGLAVDLLRIERLYPFGHLAARTATIWFTVSAATLLLLVGTELGPAMIALSVVSAAIGAWVFVGTLAQVRHAIRTAKAAELEGIRHEITELKAHLHADPAAPAKLQSLLAYEARIADVNEWPFDQTTLVRVGASSLVLTVPWFGQAFAGALVGRLSGLIR